MNVRRLAAALMLGGALLLTRGPASQHLALAASDGSTGDVTAVPLPVASQPLPIRLVIPAIHVDAAVEQLGNTPDGSMDAPAAWSDVGWYGLGFRPGDLGSAVIAGHLDSTTARAVFWDLNRLRTGDNVQVQNDDGSMLSFAVVSRGIYPFDSFPLATIFGPADVPGLNLITCNGTFDRGSENYDRRLVVYTQEVAAGP